MIVRKLRQERGWSQEQLAQMSGLNIRTIQRIERGQKAGLESLKSLAAVFEIELSILNPTQESPPMEHMNATNAAATEQVLQPLASAQPNDVRPRVMKLLVRFSLIIAMAWAINLATNPQYLWAIFPTISLAFVVLYVATAAFTPNDPDEQKLLDKFDMTGNKRYGKAPPQSWLEVRNRLGVKLIRYLLIIALLFSINLLFIPIYMWAWWPTFGLAVTFIFQTINLISQHLLNHKSS